MEKIIGIDFGTTNTIAAVVINGKPVIIPNDVGSEMTPSVVSINDLNKQALVGETAKRNALLKPLETIFSVKSLLGVSYKEIEHIVRYLPYEVINGKNEEIFIKIGKRKYTAIEISALIFENVKKNAASFLGFEVSQAIVTVPAYYNSLQRNAIKSAAEMAGWNVKRIINEPTAAALALKHLYLNPRDEKKIVIVHLGGGTIDVSVLNFGDGVYQVRSTSGESLFGGDDIDNYIQHWAKEALLRLHENIDCDNEFFRSHLKWECEKAKRELSENSSFELCFWLKMKKSNKYLQERILLDRDTLNFLQKKYIEKILETVKMCIGNIHCEVANYSLVLVGQQSRNPFIKKSVEEYFDNRTVRGFDPALIVAEGAAIQGGILTGEVSGFLLLDITPLSIGVETFGGVMTKIIESNSTIPTKKTQTFSTKTANQASVEIHVLQGERVMAKNNKSIGKLYLDGIPPAPGGIPKIEVTFDIDANGILSVSAQDKTTGKSITVRYE